MTAEIKQRVLVVDDEPEILQLVKILLSRIHVDTVTVESASAAVQILKVPPPPDLIILDLMMPEVSGLQLLKQLRSREMFKEVPVIVLSAMIDPDQIREALTTGADRYLTKPYMANNLPSMVQEILRTGRPVKT